MSGDELAHEIGSRKGSKLTPGTIYPALKRLKKYKLVYFRKSGRKKVYGLTKNGVQELNALYYVFKDFFSGLKHKFR